MKLRTIISIPRTATLADVNDVIEFLTGLGSATADFPNWKIVAEFEPIDQPSMDISAAIVSHTVQEIETALHDTGAAERPHHRITEAVSAGLGLLDRWDEIQTELAARCWDRPSWEIRS